MMIIILMLYTQVSALCRNQMHSILAEDLASEASRFLDRRRQHQLHHRAASSAWAGESVEEAAAWRAELPRTFMRVHAQSSLTCACGAHEYKRGLG
jgi:hypothetical protein